MRKIILFNTMSADGYFEGLEADISWHNVDAAFNEFAVELLNTVDTILFGRKTYQLMESFWPTEAAKKDDPAVAELMNSTNKIVFSKTIKQINWKNTRVIQSNIENEIVKLKQQPGKNIVILGSADLSSTLINAGLIDEFRIVVSSVILGNGRLLFNNIEHKIKLNLIKSATFASGNVLLHYERAK